MEGNGAVTGEEHSPPDPEIPLPSHALNTSLRICIMMCALQYYLYLQKIIKNTHIYFQETVKQRSTQQKTEK
jgi:hypothetical protein